MHEDQRARGHAARPGDPARIQDHQHGRLLDGRYRIGIRIARGGMASVYEAVDTRLDRTVAVKIMHPGLGDSTTQDDDSFARRFVSEAKAAARISHPNVVAVFDQGRDESDGTVYLVMEYVPGHTLRDTVTKDAPMSPERALALLDPVLSALGAAHRAGLIHRDVKPENVLIATDPSSGASRIKVADFGLAKAVSADTQHTATNGVLIGTVSYLAPELVVEQRADARADVYAVGVILFELLTGTKPHTGETPIAVAYRHVHEDVPLPSSVVPGIPDYVDALTARATTRDPSLRPADATVLLHHVRRVVQALHDGLRSDPELVADLLPAARAGAPAEAPAGVDGDTTPEPVSSLWDGMPDLVTPDHERTSVIVDRPQPAVPVPPRPPAPPKAARPPRQRKPGRAKRIAIALVLVLLAGALGGTGWWVGWGRYTTTPGVIGLEQAAAAAKLDKAGLGAEVKEVYSESVAKGVVVSTDPRPGARILPDGEVTLTVSRGKERYDVPDLTGKTVAEAEAALAEVKFVPAQPVEEWSETVEAGRVIRSTPAFGTPEAQRLPVGTSVTLVVSKGRKPLKVRSFVGKDADKAKQVLGKKGLDVQVVDEKYSDDVAEGRVISQTPETGTLFKGDKVELVVSKGPELVLVPAVRLKSTDDAIALLEDLGLVVRVEHADIYINGSVAWSTAPGGGTKVRKGSTVVLYVV
ncbi:MULTISPECIES: Stk1 family PASTA domain-containing Ser/Thr kinase [unclassified Nocardioides]|uniref:Stk1 family PASTA domain-containing Ser/Thr kinase n=1 Tax=unclassified Nocardioides TaxID=2615069 RepID=UPI00116790BA|nr:MULTISPECIES: Stk1 family PASTA domain-containing Ser/Thr kinase [unclassified Nocardioides]TQK70649.1 serine/threonine-protein kinase [Nocardioides sp. SLBN-35]WGX99964.1 Stk1 family PASTA domain-containing Ser/Thr kinase [Nocardioides sp. QY071]